MFNSEYFQNLIIQTLGIGIYIIDSEMNLLWINDTMKKWFGVTDNVAKKPKCFEAIFAREYLCNNCPASRQETLTKTEVSNIQLSTIKGKKRQYMFQSQLTAEGLKIIVVLDITDQYQAEKMREDFIATLTHDLRTPLLAELRTLELLTNNVFGPLNDKQTEVLSAMLISNRDLLSLVKNLLEVYRYEAGAKVLSCQYFDLAQLIEDSIFELTALAEPKQIQISSEIPEVLPMVFADKREIWRVITNLIGNAVEYTQENGKILVRVYMEPDNVIVEVRDNGRGIPVTDIDHLFERFSQGTSENLSSGTGLGLYLSKQVIQAHNGKIWAKSEPGIGSSFYFSLCVK